MKITFSRTKRQRGEIITAVLILLVLLFVFAVGESSCKYTPPGIPLSLFIDSSGKIVLSASAISIPTPLGTFDFSKKKGINPRQAFPGKKVLTIVMDGKQHFYDLGDKTFEVKIPNDLNNQSTIRYEPSTGNIFVTIPNPVWGGQPGN